MTQVASSEQAARRAQGGGFQSREPSESALTLFKLSLNWPEIGGDTPFPYDFFVQYECEYRVRYMIPRL